MTRAKLPRRDVLFVRVRAEEKDLLQLAAAHDGLSVAELVRSATLEAARRILRPDTTTAPTKGTTS